VLTDKFGGGEVFTRRQFFDKRKEQNPIHRVMNNIMRRHQARG